MKRHTVILLALGCAFSAAGPLYAADPGGMTNDTTAKNYQNALEKCQKKTGTAKSRCINSALKEKCRNLAGTAKSTCMKSPTGNQPGSPEDSSGMRPQQDEGRTGSPGGAPMGESPNGPSEQ